MGDHWVKYALQKAEGLCAKLGHTERKAASKKPNVVEERRAMHQVDMAAKMKEKEGRGKREGQPGNGKESSSWGSGKSVGYGWKQHRGWVDEKKGGWGVKQDVSWKWRSWQSRE